MPAVTYSYSSNPTDTVKSASATKCHCSPGTSHITCPCAQQLWQRGGTRHPQHFKAHQDWLANDVAGQTGHGTYQDMSNPVFPPTHRKYRGLLPGPYS